MSFCSGKEDHDSRALQLTFCVKKHNKHTDKSRPTPAGPPDQTGMLLNGVCVQGKHFLKNMNKYLTVCVSMSLKSITAVQLSNTETIMSLYGV